MIWLDQVANHIKAERACRLIELREFLPSNIFNISKDSYELA